MKVIKKYFKVVMCFMAFALCSFLMVFAPTMTALSVEAAISDYARTINAVKMPKQVDVQNGEGLTGGKIVFIDKETGDEYVTYTKLGYWGIYLPVAAYDVTLTYEDYTATDSLIVG